MPEQLYPPFADDTGALIVPRQLNRWSDVNPQSGPLQRTMSYLVLPAFTSAKTYRVCSEIVGAYNYEATNNFSLKSFVAPSDPNYSLCISYRTSAGVTRYSLFAIAGSYVDSMMLPYTGQTILKNFRFEVWNSNTGVATQATPLIFYTSVRGRVDYRFGTDTVFASSSTGLVSEFDSTARFNLIPVGAVYDYGGAHTQYQILPSLIPTGTPIQWVPGNSFALYYGGQTIYTQNFVATTGDLLVSGPTTGLLITAQILIPFALPFVFPTNSVSTIN